MAYSDQATASSPRRRRGEARTYDFRRPVRLAREHAHLLRVAMTTFARQSTTVLTTSLRAVSQMSLTTVEEMSYDEYLSGLVDQTVCAVLTLDPLPGRALMTIDQPTVLTMIDHLLGGPGSPEQPERPLTDIEQSLTRLVLGRMLRELAYALDPIAATTPELIGLENNAQFVQIAAPTDPVVVAQLELMVGNRETYLQLCLPYVMLSKQLTQVSLQSDSGQKAQLRRDASARTAARLNDVLVDVSVRFGTQILPSSTIGRLTVGDVLPLGHRLSQPLTVTSANSTFAHAVPGSSGKQLAALIVADP